MTSRAAALPGTGRAEAERALWIGVGIAVAVVLAAAVLRVQANPILAAVAIPLALAAWQRTLLAWQTLFGLILLVILFIPIRRYTVGGGLPFELEPYRLLLAVVLVAWLFAVCADPAVRWRSTGLELPALVVVAAILGSLALNVSRVNAVSGVVVKQVTFFLTFFLIVYLVASVMDRGPKLERMMRLLVAGGTLLAVLSLIEWRTGTNFFDGLHHVIPILNYVDYGDHIARGTGFRALGSAQHPIALGAALVMLIPLSVYLYRRDDHVAWLACGGLLTLGAFATGSRTAAIMLVVLLLTFLWIKRQETMRLLPMLIPLVIVIQVVMPGTLGTFRAILQPSYLVREQSQDMGPGSGRIADLGPSLSEWSQKPLLGQGFGTRVVTTSVGPGDIGAGGTVVASDVQILDNQWLTTLLEIGAVGVLGLVWLFCLAVRRLARRARSDPGPDGWLATALAAALAAFAVGMLTFDAFAFIQVTFLAFIMLGFTAVLTREEGT